MAAPPSIRRPRPPTSRKRISIFRLSTDTTSSLPAYSSSHSRSASATDWSHNNPLPHPIEDQPPDYPQSAEEADQEDDPVPLRNPRTPLTRRFRHRRSDSTSHPNTSPSVDDLLERSVVALELSTNALLQSIGTQSTVSAIANDPILDKSLDRQAQMLDMHIRGSRNAHQGWMDDLEQVIKGVDGLFTDPPDSDAGLSRSLPTDNSHLSSRRHHRSHHLPKSKSDSPYLHLSTSDLDLRESLRPPRALTQYVSVKSASGEACEATADPESIYLPSTTGLRSTAQVRTFAVNGPRPPCLRQSVSSPGLNSTAVPSTPAYNMLSHLANQHSSRSPSRTASPPASLSSPGNSDYTSRRKARRYSADSIDSSRTLTTLRRSRSNSRGRSSNSTATPPLPPPVRAMTPPLEEPTPTSSSSSTTSLNAFRTMQSLRKILDEAPPDPKSKLPAPTSPPRRRFQPRSPSVLPSSGTSTATASVSRLLTRSSHHGPHVAAHARHSSLKKPQTPGDTPSVPGTPSTEPSTPRNVSFAELPESYPGRSRRRGKKQGRDKGKESEKDKGRGSRAGWWSGWFADVAGTGLGAGAARHDERMEDRMLKWGRPGVGSGGTEDWML